MIKNNKIFNSCFKAGGVLFCIFAAVFFTVFGATFANAQTAMVTSVTTNYPIDTDTEINYQCIDVANDDYNVSFIYSTQTAGVYNALNANPDPWHNSALIEFDQPYPSASEQNKYPNHCLQLCAQVTCLNPARKMEASDGSASENSGILQDVASTDFPIQSVLFEIFKFQPGSNPYNADTTPPVRTIALTPTDSNICPGVRTYTEDLGSGKQRQVSCCDLINTATSYKCVSNVSCAGLSQTNCTGTSGCTWLIQNTCEIKTERKYCDSITNRGHCGSTYACKWTRPDKANGHYCVNDCSQYTNSDDCFAPAGTAWNNQGVYCKWVNSGSCMQGTSSCTGLDEAHCVSPCLWVPDTGTITTHTEDCATTIDRFGGDYDKCAAGLTYLNFCTSWDGSYEIDGEFGKSNGQFGFRTNVKTKWPGDGVSTGGDVEVDHTMAYPGENQIPIQVDVTNVHSVRSSSTIVGTTTPVPAQPYQLTYKLSKDATTTIRITDPGDSCDCVELTDYPTHPGYWAYSGCTSSQRDGAWLDLATRVNFDVVKGQPRLGEGIPDGVNINLDSWDGRDDQGTFLPYGNYLVDITATTHDEWTLDTDDNVPDISRTVTRQLSLDPLKITDIKETGLAKLSTSYAKIDYVLTEPATVHLMVFTPGTYFTDVDMPGLPDPADTILSRVRAGSGTLVAHIIEQKQARVNVNTKWDGVCQESICTISNTPGTVGLDPVGTRYKFGTPMPDGDYVYVMWAEIPYSYTNHGSIYHPGGGLDTPVKLPRAVCVNGKWWAGVRTHKYYNGILPINRGLPEITVGAVGYSTLGSSPTAFGLDPFSFNYSVSRDAIVDATIKTTAVNMAANLTTDEQVYTVKKLLTNEVAVASKQNHFTWDGIDEAGYQVSPGTYMVEFVAKDSLYPEKQATMTVQFPVDMFRVVDVNTTSLLDEATAQATINYTLSKSMDVVVEIYDQNVTIPVNDCTDPDDPEENCWCKFSTTTASTGTPILNHVRVNGVEVPPIKSFTLPKAGEGTTITEVWDGLKHSVDGTSGVAPLPDGNYPYRICTRSTQDISHWYKEVNGLPVAQNGDDDTVPNHYKDGASDKPTGFVTIARGSIAFNKVLVTPSQPQMKYSSETIYLPSYEVGFSTSRPASVQIQVLSTAEDQCLLDPNNTVPAGTVCRTLSTYVYEGVDGYFDPTKIYKVYWDGKDSKGNYVKYGSYEIKLKGLPYPLPAATPNPMTGDIDDTAAGMPLPTIFSQVISVNNFQVYDRYVEDITRDNPNAKFAYQISVPMKVAIQIFKPGTMTNRDSGTAKATGLIDPVTGTDVRNDRINDVLVKSIVGVRPNLVSIDEVWDGTDYAGQEVPDGVYPYRYVTVLNAYDMDSVTGALNHIDSNDPAQDRLSTAGSMVADWEKYITLEHINVARGDSWYADVDWKSKKVTSFFPNPLNKEYGWFEIAKLPAPGKVTIKIYNIAGDLVRSGGYECINAQMETATLEQINNGVFGNDFGLQPYMNLTAPATTPTEGVSRNFTLRCKWDKTNDHGKKVARGLYYAIMELNPTRGNAKKSQRVIKILIP